MELGFFVVGYWALQMFLDFLDHDPCRVAIDTIRLLAGDVFDG